MTSDAAGVSAAARKCLFWHNIPAGADDKHRGQPINATTLLEDGAVLKGGRTCAPCLMTNWQCCHQQCRHLKGTRCSSPDSHTQWHRMSTHDPVVVVQDGKERQLRPTEAEAIMGLPHNYTRMSTTKHGGKQVADIELLARIGNGIDTRKLGALTDLLADAPKRRGREHTEQPIGPTVTTSRDHVHPHTSRSSRSS